MLNEAIGKYAAVTVWESKEDVEAAVAATIPQLRQAIAGMAKAPPVLGRLKV
jgi:hypothetical protein